MVFNQVRQGRISDNIVAQIKSAILTGSYQPGDKLPSEKQLEKLFNVSRVPLREALRSLEEMGFIVIKAGVLGGAFVAQMGIKSVSDSLSNMVRLGKVSFREIWEFRILVEPSMASMAAKRHTDWELNQMREIVTTREKALKAHKAPVVASIDFHQTVARAAQNPLSILILDALSEIVLENLKGFNFSMADHQSIARYHREIYESIEKKDGERAEGLMRAHLEDVRKRLKI